MDLVLSVVIVIAVQLVGFLFLRGRIHQELNTTSLLKDVQSEVDGMVRELNLSAERNIGLLEARIEELEGLLAQADQKMVLMAREVDRREKTAEVYSQLKRPQAPPTEPEVAGEPTQVAAPAAQSALPFAEPSEPVFELKASPEPEKPRSLKERVLAHRDQGMEPAAIAAVTGATRGEVELILSLNPVSWR